MGAAYCRRSLDQREKDDTCARLHRMEQLAHNTKGLVVGAKWTF